MATLEILINNCQEDNCNARSTRMLKDERGTPVGMYCARHANIRLVELAKQEGKAIRPTAATPIESGKAVRA